MSMERTESVTCPKCGKVSDFIIWESLNADIDPEAQVQLIDGSIFLQSAVANGHWCGGKRPQCGAPAASLN